MRNSQKYIEQAALTLSNEWHGKLVSFALLLKAMQNCKDALADLEAIKKTIFYGKPLPQNLQELNNGIGEAEFLSDALSPNTCAAIGKFFENEEAGQNFIHGILGACSETGELLEILTEALESGSVERIKVAAEMGDVMWYFAIVARALGFDFEQVQDMNIAKLQTRFPEGFKAYNALHRNEAKETAAIEKVEISA